MERDDRRTAVATAKAELADRIFLLATATAIAIDQRSAEVAEALRLQSAGEQETPGKVSAIAIGTAAKATGISAIEEALVVAEAWRGKYAAVAWEEQLHLRSANQLSQYQLENQ